MTLSTPTSVFIPLNSQRTSSQSTQLCRSGRINSVGSIPVLSNRMSQEQNDQNNPQGDPINRKRDKASRADPVHEPRDHRKRDDKGDHESYREDDPSVRVNGQRRKIAFV